MGGSSEGNWGTPINALTLTLMILVILFALCRIATRYWIVHAFWWDDATILLAVLGNTIGAGLDFVEVHYGFGTHERFLTAHEVREFQKYTYGEWIQTFFTLMWTKVSICLFLMRIPNSKPLRRPMQCAVAFLILSNVVLTMIWIMQCQPIRAAWDDSGICLSREDRQAVILTQAIISCVSDFAFAAFPIVILWRVQIDRKTKLGLWVLMGLGFITGGCCLVRTVLKNEALALDATYDGIVNWVWRLFEVTLGIIAACVPTLRPGYKWVVSRIKGERGPLDSNIRMGLKEQRKSWVENTTQSTESTKPMQPVEKGELGDTMKEDLIREGIVKRDQPDIEKGREVNAPFGEDDDFRRVMPGLTDMRGL